jgi:dephospho-CoA kinase
MRFVVTGNMGCGKSTVVQMMREMLPDHQLFDFDTVVHGLYEDPNLQVGLLLQFGVTDRKQVSDIVHANSTKMATLERMFNAHILEHVTLAFKQDDIILDIPLYFEYLADNATLKCDGVVCVTCEPSIQRNRIRSRNGFSDEKIDQILSKQLPQIDKAKRSNVVIDNSGTVDDLRKQVVAFVEKGFT